MLKKDELSVQSVKILMWSKTEEKEIYKDIFAKLAKHFSLQKEEKI